jgi:hypothetical protein
VVCMYNRREFWSSYRLPANFHRSNPPVRIGMPERRQFMKGKILETLPYQRLTLFTCALWVTVTALTWCDYSACLWQRGQHTKNDTPIPGAELRILPGSDELRVKNREQQVKNIVLWSNTSQLTAKRSPLTPFLLQLEDTYIFNIIYFILIRIYYIFIFNLTCLFVLVQNRHVGAQVWRVAIHLSQPLFPTYQWTLQYGKASKFKIIC